MHDGCKLQLYTAVCAAERGSGRIGIPVYVKDSVDRFLRIHGKQREKNSINKKHTIEFDIKIKY